MKSLQEILRFVRISNAQEVIAFQALLNEKHTITKQNTRSDIPLIFNDILAYVAKDITVNNIKNDLKKDYANLTNDLSLLKQTTIQFILTEQSKSNYEKVCQLIANAQNLYTKGFYVWSKQLNTEAEILATNHELFELIPIILKLKIQLERNSKGIIQDNSIELEQRESLETLLRINELELRQSELYFKIFPDPMGSRKEKEIKYSALETNSVVTKNEALRQCINRLLIHTEKAEWKKKLEQCKIAIDLILQDSNSNENFDTYLAFFVEKMIGCYVSPEINDYLQAKSLIDRFQNYKWTCFSAKIYFEQFIIPIFLRILQKTETIAVRKTILKELESKFLKNHHFYSDEANGLISFCFLNESCSLFEIKNAVKWLDFLETTDFIKGRQDLVDATELLRLLIYTETYEYQKVENKCRNIKRRLKNRKRYYKSEQKIVHYFKLSTKYHSTMATDKKSNAKFIKLTSNLIEEFIILKKDKNEKPFFLYFDWIRWFKKKLETISQV